MNTGILFLVATPIGNLDDITFRAVKILKEVDIIACEDTRKASILLNHYQINKKLISYFEHNEKERSAYLIENLLSGRNIALISNAGSPLISDPGFELVNQCIKNNIKIEVIPGACALIAAFTISGLPTDRLFFTGFLPRKTSKRKKRIEEISGYSSTTVIYESPYRLRHTLENLKEILGNRQIAVIREITKIHEEVIRGTIEEVLKIIDDRKIKGEIVIVVKGAPD